MSNYYTPTTWVGGETIGTADVMNNIEKGISSSHDRLDVVNNSISELSNKDTILDNKITNMELLNSKQSLATNGYKILPGGLIIQWGYQLITPTAPDVVTLSSIKFPIAFPSACRSVQVSPRTAVPDKVSSASTNVTTTGFDIAMTRTNTTDTGYTWLAIGY